LIVTKNSSAESKSSTKAADVPLSPGKFIDRSLPPTPSPEIDIPKSHSIWDSDTAKVSLLSATSNNNNDKISLSSLSLKEELKIQPWYKSWDRKKAEQMLLKLNKNGGFIVRDSIHGGAESPFTLTVFNEGKVFNINIRVKQAGQVALGKEKFDETIYSSIEDMVNSHKYEALKLTSASQKHPCDSNTTLNCWPT